MSDGHHGRTLIGAAITGGLWLVPFVALNAVVSLRIEPLFSLIRPGSNANALEIVLLIATLGCIPVGAYFAARPLFDRTLAHRPAAWLVNGTLSVAMLVLFALLLVGLGGELYRCEVLGVPNCD